MNSQRLAVALTVLNLALVLNLSLRGGPVRAQGDTPTLRGRGLELVDAAGQVRAEINLEPDGEAVFRMRDAKGTIRVKLGASGEGSGLVLLDEATEPGVQIIARQTASATRPTTTSVNLLGAGGQRRVIAP